MAIRVLGGFLAVISPFQTGTRVATLYSTELLPQIMGRDFL